MNKVEKVKEAKELVRRLTRALNDLNGNSNDGVRNTRIDKYGVFWHVNSLEHWTGYYGDSSVASFIIKKDAPEFVFIKKALECLSNKILQKAIELAQKDRDEKLIEAEQEIKVLLDEIVTIKEVPQRKENEK